MTQGLVSVIHDGQVIFKIVAGCEGYRAKGLASLIMQQSSFPLGKEKYLRKLINLAALCSFGCERCIVAVSANAIMSPSEESDDLEKTLYRSEFKNPRFNPRWERGDGAVTYIVDLDKNRIIECRGKRK